VPSRLRVDLSEFFLLLPTLVLVLLLNFRAARLDLLRDLLVCFELLVDFLLGFIPLGDEHLPSADVVHGLILVSKEVSLDKGAIFHRHFLPLALDRSFALDVCKGDLDFLLIITFGSHASWSTLACSFACVCPARELGRLDNDTSEEFTECVEELSLLFWRFDHVSVLGERCLQAVVDSLGEVIVECREELFLRDLADVRVFN